MLQVNMPGTSSSYNDPIDALCRQSFVVVMTDGIPRHDNNDTWTGVMEGVATGAADTDGDEPTWPAGPQTCPTSDTDVPPVLDGDCDRGGWLDDISKYAYETDIVDDATMTGVQSLVTYTVGFTIDQDLLEDAADATHGRVFGPEPRGSLRGQAEEATVRREGDVVGIGRQRHAERHADLRRALDPATRANRIADTKSSAVTWTL